MRDVDLPAAIGLPPEHVHPVLWKFLKEFTQSILYRQSPYEADRGEIAVDEDLPDLGLRVAIPLLRIAEQALHLSAERRSTVVRVILT